MPEAESANDGACRAELQGLRLVLRVARTTPAKTGQCVTLWKRLHRDADITALDESDPLDYVIIAVDDGDEGEACRRGLFVFARAVLLQRGVMCKACSVLEK